MGWGMKLPNDSFRSFNLLMESLKMGSRLAFLLAMVLGVVGIGLYWPKFALALANDIPWDAFVFLCSGAVTLTIAARMAARAVWSASDRRTASVRTAGIHCGDFSRIFVLNAGPVSLDDSDGINSGELWRGETEHFAPPRHVPNSFPIRHSRIAKDTSDGQGM
jgi:hypothetical protein